MTKLFPTGSQTATAMKNSFDEVPWLTPSINHCTHVAEVRSRNRPLEQVEQTRMARQPGKGSKRKRSAPLKTVHSSHALIVSERSPDPGPQYGAVRDFAGAAWVNDVLD